MDDRDGTDSRNWSASTIHTARPRSSDSPRGSSGRRPASFGGPRRPGGPGRALRSFIRRYGWRAYALPILAILTVVALLTSRNGDPGPSRQANGAGAQPASNQEPEQPSQPGPQSHSQPARTAPSTPTAPPTASGNISLKPDLPSADSLDTVLKAAALPAGGAYTRKGDGTFRVLKGATKVVGHGQLYRYDIEIENGVTGVNATQFENLVDRVLDDPRSWSGHGVSLQRVDSGPVDFHISLTSALTVRKFCGYSIPVESSCYASAGTGGSPVDRVLLDDARWVRGATAYVGDLHAYRIYMINHEDGHALGHLHAHECLSNGLAPAMMQQTFGLVSAATGKMCQANPWPYPPGATDAPGAEQQDTDQNNEYNLQD
jgi:hypothetical protein